MQLDHGVFPRQLDTAPGAIQPDEDRDVAQRRFRRYRTDQTRAHHTEQRATFVNTQHAGLEQHTVLEPQRDHLQRKGGQRHQQPCSATA